MTIEALIMMIAVFVIFGGGFIYSLYLSSKED
jgi:archaellum component FlaF (FlaF/FlaG flagellin family)